MIEVTEALLDWMTQLFNMFISKGYIGLYIVCAPLFVRIVRAVRSIISKGHS